MQVLQKELNVDTLDYFQSNFSSHRDSSPTLKIIDKGA